MCDRSSCSWSVTKIIEEVSRVYRDRRKFSLVILFSIDASLLLCNFLVPSLMLVLRNSDDSFSNGRRPPLLLLFASISRLRSYGVRSRIDQGLAIRNRRVSTSGTRRILYRCRATTRPNCLPRSVRVSDV